MSRHVHLWFLTGIIIGMTGTFSVWLAAVMAGDIWSTQWGWLIAAIDAFVFPWAFWEWRQRWKRAFPNGRRPISHETRCRWDFARRKAEPACARRARDADWYIGG
jgi:hypothetical protein